jgi:hypothetical protein
MKQQVALWLACGVVTIGVATALRQANAKQYWATCLGLVGGWFVLINALNGAPILSTPALLTLGGAPAVGAFTVVRRSGFRQARFAVAACAACAAFLGGQFLALLASILVLNQ